MRQPHRILNYEFIIKLNAIKFIVKTEKPIIIYMDNFNKVVPEV